MKTRFALGLALVSAAVLVASPTPTPKITGYYLEARSCDIYTGACVANAEMGITGKEGILVWNIRQGAWKGTALDGLSVIAVVRSSETLGDTTAKARSTKAVFLVDEKATAAQKTALVDMAQGLSGKLISEVVETKSIAMEVSLGNCTKEGCARIKAGNLVEISTRCLGDKDHMCGNEDLFYPPLTKLDHAIPAFSEIVAYRGEGLGMTWQGAGQRNVYIGSFAQ